MAMLNIEAVDWIPEIACHFFCFQIRRDHTFFPYPKLPKFLRC